MELVYGFGFISLVLIILYTLIPDLLIHRLGIGSWKRHYAPGVAITFDDGPDPEMTPRILDVLDKLGVKAVFFVVGEKVQKHPDLIRLIRAQGHQLGAHCQHHQHAWFMPPWKTWREWDNCIAALQESTGENIAWIRPPWASFNLALCLWMMIKHKRAVLFSVEGHDWQAKRTPEQITRRILKKVRDGSIVVLHDSGGEKGAPEQTLKALENICREIREDKKLPLVELEFPKWKIRRRMAFTLWETWERLFARLYKIERINSTNIFRLSKTRYKGPDLYTPEGELLATRGDLVGEIHFDNSRLAICETSLIKTGWQSLRQAQESLPELARYISAHPGYQEIKVFLGLSMINRGVKRLGFQIQDVPLTRANYAVGLLQRVIHYIYNPTRRQRTDQHTGVYPKIVWTSTQQLYQMWLDK